MSAPLKIVLFVGSVRENRLGNRVIAFVKNVLKERKQLAVNVFGILLVLSKHVHTNNIYKHPHTNYKHLHTNYNNLFLRWNQGLISFTPRVFKLKLVSLGSILLIP